MLSVKGIPCFVAGLPDDCFLKMFLIVRNNGIKCICLCRHMSSIYTVSLLPALHYQLVLFDSKDLQQAGCDQTTFLGY